jgi:hypothetical protein
MTEDVQVIPRQLTGRIQLPTSLVDRAREGDEAALNKMFHQFIPREEEIHGGAYLGIQGWLFGRHSFSCVTDRRTAGLMIGAFGEVTYQDGYHEHVNSGIVYQPSRLLLILGGLAIFASTLFFVFAFADSAGGRIDGGELLVLMLIVLLGTLFGVYWPKLFYRFVKCGLVLWVREGVPIYLFANRGLIKRANALYRLVTERREIRLREVRPF